MILANSTAYNSYPPVWYPPFYAKYGVKEYKASSIFSFGLASSPKAYDPTKYSLMLFNFYIKNNISENGTLTVKGSNQYKIGERVILESEDMEYYIEGVSHTFNMYASWVTTLSVTRGLHPAERFTPPYGAAEDFTPIIAMALRGMTASANGEIDWANLKEQSFAIQNADGTTSDSLNMNAGNGESMVGADGQWYSFANKVWTHPCPQCTIMTSPFGWRTPPTYGASSFHGGIDLACNGDALGKPIVAAGAGLVVYAGSGSGYGNCIDIYHGNGYLTRYAHMYAETIKVSVGQQVVVGQHIADVGNAGVGTGAHLHFELHTDATESAEGTKVDPTQLFAVTTQAPAFTRNGTRDTSYDNVTASSSLTEIVSSCYNYLRNELNYNKCAACAVLGVIQYKSKFRISGTGLMNLTSITDLQTYCRVHNCDIDSITGQLGYLNSELTLHRQNALSVLTLATNERTAVSETAKAFKQAWDKETSLTTTDTTNQCGTYAENWWDEFD